MSETPRGSLQFVLLSVMGYRAEGPSPTSALSFSHLGGEKPDSFAELSILPALFQSLGERADRWQEWGHSHAVRNYKTWASEGMRHKRIFCVLLVQLILPKPHHKHNVLFLGERKALATWKVFMTPSFSLLRAVSLLTCLSALVFSLQTQSRCRSLIELWKSFQSPALSL